MQARPFRISYILAVLFHCLAGPAAWALTSLTQHRINEYAAACMSAEISLKGLKGSPIVGETPAQFTARIQGYIRGVEAGVKATEPLRKMPKLRAADAENMQRWQRITTSAARLPVEIDAVKAAWKEYPKLKEKAGVGQKLLKCLVSIQTMLNTLRDARP